MKKRIIPIAATRGSIEVGKYADFLLVNKNIMDGPVDKIHTAKIDKVYFEGQQVYDARK